MGIIAQVGFSFIITGFFLAIGFYMGQSFCQKVKYWTLKIAPVLG